MKKLLLFSLVFIASCQSISNWIHRDSLEDLLCPNVNILRDDSYITQFVHYKETFQISITGYEGYCYFDEPTQRYRAVVRPTFKIKRLRPSDETDVRFSYYTETVKGPPEYLGKKTYFATVHIPLDAREKEYTAPQTLAYIPNEMENDYDINLGLWISPEEAKYNHRTFDINYRYMEEEDE